MEGRDASGRLQLRALADRPVTDLSGVGPTKAKALEEMGITTVLDLVTHYPRRYIDRTQQVAVKDLKVGEEAMVLAHVKRVSTRRTRQGRALVEIDVFDGTAYLRCTFFNQGWRAKQLVTGRQAVFFGKLDLFRGRRQMTNPVVDLIGDRTGRIVPVYPQSDKAGLSTWELADWIESALRRAGELADPLPERWQDELGMVGRTKAMNQIHAPDSMPAKDAGRRRLAFDELARLQVALVMRKRKLEQQAVGISHTIKPEPGKASLLEEFQRRLPFSLTGAQERAIAAIEGDLAKAHPMHRLLQGDVGAGKTVVALAALLVAVQGGHQGALMAPTEVLAEQHHAGVRWLLRQVVMPDESTLTQDRPVRVELLTNRTTPTERARLHDGLRAGTVDILVGTHALLTEEVAFSSLGVVVVDEQHRFGVEQRDILRGKGRYSGGADPDVLVMTATPIPRTAAMTMYGDLDVTVLDELPPGRTPVKTTWARGPLEVESAWDTVRREVAAGRQAYVVCPLVEESERVQARSATQERERLAREDLPGLQLGLLHGQMPAREKESVMADFRDGKLDVLVATTVIEVGVDVPTATVMVIEDADRFGMAQLHQLRGRVGRGKDASWCYLLGEGSSPEGEKRLEALQESTDGFHLAEVDLDLRGEGTVLGTRQKGRSDLKLASLRRDRELVAQARQMAFDIVDADPMLGAHDLLADEVRLMIDEDEAEFLFKS
ncbi:MAG TPA: ATP-dependent DNA helicase RecG [Acidimicrobiales bacterium]|nr:ATP-dependent DNA helicase RecG [Acidimicrobiales bacterium]